MPLELDQIAASFDSNKDEAAGAFSRSFGTEMTFASVQSASLSSADWQNQLDQAGLLLLAKADEANALFILPEPSSILPDWYRTPDTTQNGMIQTLALEIGSLLLPESLEALDFKAIAVSSVAGALQRSGLEETAHWVSYETKAGDATETIWLTWTCPNPDQLADPVEEEAVPSESDGAAEETQSSQSTPASQDSTLPPPDDFLKPQPTSQTVDSKVDQIDDLLKQAAEAQQAAMARAEEHRPLSPLAEFRKKLPADFDAAIHFLPIYTKSLLRIRVPVVVNLATMKKPVSQVIELGLGSILQFDKACDEPLSLEVGGRRVAFGEVVKVGDKFGLRISSISLPPERFAKIRGPLAGDGSTTQPEAGSR